MPMSAPTKQFQSQFNRFGLKHQGPKQPRFLLVGVRVDANLAPCLRFHSAIRSGLACPKTEVCERRACSGLLQRPWFMHARQTPRKSRLHRVERPASLSNHALAVARRATVLATCHRKTNNAVTANAAVARSITGRWNCWCDEIIVRRWRVRLALAWPADREPPERWRLGQ